MDRWTEHFEKLKCVNDTRTNSMEYAMADLEVEITHKIDAEIETEKKNRPAGKDTLNMELFKTEGGEC